MRSFSGWCVTLLFVLVGCSDDGGGARSASGGSSTQGASTGSSGQGGSSAQGTGGSSAQGSGGSAAQGGSGGGSTGGGSTGGAGGSGPGVDGGAGGPISDSGVPDGWPGFDEVARLPLSTSVLVILVDFSDSEIGSFLPEPESKWSGMMFGTSPGQANHYWYEASTAHFQLIRARETFGQANDGVVHVHLSTPRPTTGTFVVQDQTWIPEALDQASKYVPFAEYDTDGNKQLDNRELSVLFVLNIDFQRINGAGAEANIRIDRPIAGTGVTLQKFTRVQADYTSIGVPVHELGHHILGLSHTPSPSEHDLMGLGSYTQDPVIGLLHRPTDHWATRPTHPAGIHKVRAKFVQTTPVSDTMRGVKLYSPHMRDYNVLQIPVVDGFLFVENRTAEGYDQSIAFCNGHTGGIFMHDVAQYLQPLNVAVIETRRIMDSFDIPKEKLCEYYSLKGNNDSFSIGQFTFSNISEAGPVMTMDIVKRDLVPAIEKFKFRWWVVDPNMAGYRMWHIETAKAGGTTIVDYAKFVDGTNPNAYNTIAVDAYYNTGELRAVNPDITFTSTSDYVKINLIPLDVNPGAYKKDMIIQIQLVPTAPHVSSAVVNVKHVSGFTSSFTLTNIP